MSVDGKLVKEVSVQLKKYIDKTRKEDGFDLSGINRPSYNLNRIKFNKLFGYSVVSDEAIKHNFERPELRRAMSAHLNIVNTEKFIKDEIVENINKPSKLLNGYSKHDPKLKFYYTRSDKTPSAPAYIPLGILALRSRETGYLTKGEKLRILDTTSQLLSLTDQVIREADSKKHKNNRFIRK